MRRVLSELVFLCLWAVSIGIIGIAAYLAASGWSAARDWLSE